ncbi:MAG TPA: bacteriohopanetetrol glucosamine biosynthesis glycosyltransferase HpnI [Acidisarcina sp.]|nr:bacteriohopanetetrol glucosamine biosynthesis glycosyltransferase HpnI [Acidisarcina sp.]
MIKLLFGLGALGLFTSTVFTAMVAIGVWRFVRMRRQRSLAAAPADLPPVTLLKPLHGSEPNLEEHLTSFFQQDYPVFEILFCARQSEDLGLQTAMRVAARFPHIPVKFVTTGEPQYINAKVASLERMEAVASHSLLVISDSDVRVRPDYLRRIVAPFADPGVGLLTCLYRGVAADNGIWSRLEAAGMSVEMTSGVLVADLTEGMRFALGPTMVVRRECVQEIGGFGVLGDYCADDFVLGNLVSEKGHTVVLSEHIIDHIVINARFVSSVKHQIRWMKSTRFSRPLGHLGTVLTFSVPFGLLSGASALALGMPWLGLGLFAWSVLSRSALAVLVGSAVVGESHLLRLALLYPLRDLLGFCYWSASYLNDKIVWRGEIYRLIEGGRMRSTSTKAPKKPEPALTTPGKLSS